MTVFYLTPQIHVETRTRDCNHTHTNLLQNQMRQITNRKLSNVDETKYLRFKYKRPENYQTQQLVLF